MDNDVETLKLPFLENSLEITEVSKYGKFIEVEEWKGPNGEIEYRNKGVLFTCKNLTEKKLSQEARNASLVTMRNILYKIINDETDKEIELIRAKIIKKKEKKYNLHLFTPKFSEAS